MMACDVNPPNLPRSAVGSSILSKPEIKVGAPGFDFSNIQHVRWDAPKLEFSKNVEGFNQLKPHDSVERREDVGGRHDHHPTLFSGRPKAQPLEWRQAKPCSNSSTKRGVCSIQGRNKDLETGLGRRAKRMQSQSKPTSPPSSLVKEFGFGGGSRTGKLEKNRVAASKCREKKKRETANLQVRERALAAERDALKSMADALRMQVLGLKNEVLRHGMCDCSVIQQYIVETARQIA
ncbi:hypothetical protein F5Y13DRAFT_149938 [Hypoxylon sp. FL1857]|nr:hypothetical protein F5Y13DRAFT_149938 [Hypoxylon sp. FL1857]